MRPNRILLLLAIALVAGIALSLWSPLRIVSSWWVAAVCGTALGADGGWTLSRTWDREAHTDLGVAGALVTVYAGAALIANTWWPIILLPVVLAGIVRWRAVQIQTGRRQPG